MVDLLFSFLAKAIAEALQLLVDLLMPLLDFDFDTFVSAFPFAADSYPIFQGIAIGIILLLAAFQLLPFFTGGHQNRSSPIRVGVFTLLAVFGVFYGNYILQAIMDIAQIPFDAMLNADGTDWSTWSFFSIEGVINSAVYQGSTLLYIIILVLVGIAFIKLMLEAIERYVILFVLIYASPLASSSLASEETTGICKRYFSMFFSQCLLMILNVWSLKMTISMFSAMSASTTPMLVIFLGYAFLRIAARLDSYLNQIGLNAAATGIGLGGELMAAGMMMLSRFSPAGARGGATGGAGAGSGGILGAAQSVSKAIGKVSPAAMLGDTARNALGGIGKTASQSINAAREAAAGTEGGFMDKLQAGARQAGITAKDNIGQNLHSGWMKTQDSSYWARAMDGSGSWQAFSNYEGSLTEQQRDDVANNADLAAKGFNAFTGDAATYESADIASIMKGTGIENADLNASEAVDVGYGNTEAENAEFSLNKDGIEASFTRDGREEYWSIKNASQFQALTPEQQHGYTPYKDANGHQYYYRHASSRAPTDAQKQRSAVESNISAFGNNPSANPLTQDSFTAMRRDPTLFNNAMRGMTGSGASFSNTPEGRAQVGNLVNSMPLPRTRQSSEVMQNVQNGLADGTATVAGDGNRFSISAPVSDGSYGLDVVTSQGAASMDVSELTSQGYNSFNVGGETWYAKYSAPPTPAETAETELTAFYSNPSASELSAPTVEYMKSHPAMAAGVIPKLAETNGSIPYNEQTQKFYQDYVSSLKMEGVSAKVQNAAAMAVGCGEVNGTPTLNGDVFHLSFNHEGKTHNIQVLPQHRVADKDTGATTAGGRQVYTKDYVANRGYSRNIHGGNIYYSRHREERADSNADSSPVRRMDSKD